MPGSWLGPEEDLKQRKKRGWAAWTKAKSQLKGSRLSKACQAKITQACVESTMLFDCQVQTWHLREIKTLESSVDRMFRYIWSNKRRPPLIHMQQEGVNLQDIRSDFDIKTLRWKIEKRCLERISHIMRIEDNRMVKAVTLGWLEDLERN